MPPRKTTPKTAEAEKVGALNAKSVLVGGLILPIVQFRENDPSNGYRLLVSIPGGRSREILIPHASVQAWIG